jgi:hypothetical protein
LGQIDDAEEHLQQQRKGPTAREPMGRTSTVEGGGGEMQMREMQFWGLKGDGAGKEARAGPTCQHPWRTDQLYASGAEIPEAYNKAVRLRCWHVGPAT